MPKKGASSEHNWSFAFSPRKSHPRPRPFQEDRRTLQNILVDSVKDCKFRKNEMFKRMKVTTFVQLVLQLAEFEPRDVLPPLNETETPFRPDTADLEVQKIQNENGGGGGIGIGGGGATSAMTFRDHLDTHRSTREELMLRIGEPENSTRDSTRALINSNTCPYLLLDIRDRDSFEECHIITAKSYPSPTLARSVNNESKDMLRFKNREGKIIILYDNGESEVAMRAATTLVERGYENHFLLTGGLKQAYKVFPKALITGTVPVSLAGDHVMEGAKVKASSKPQTARTPVPADRADFSQDDLDCLHIYIDNALKDNSCVSRLTQKPKGPPGRNSSLSSLSTSTNTTGAGRRPFKP